MAKKWAATDAFTIIELLVSIVVIGILATIMIVSYTGVQQRARDSQRDSDITQLKIAIEKYHADQSKYPGVCSGGDNSACSASSLSTELSSYLKQIPHDPRYVAESVDDYTYIRSTTQADGYALLVHYEAKAICKTGQNISASWWNTNPTC